jgi:hypothetical protein
VSCFLWGLDLAFRYIYQAGCKYKNECTLHILPAKVVRLDFELKNFRYKVPSPQCFWGRAFGSLGWCLAEHYHRGVGSPELRDSRPQGIVGETHRPEPVYREDSTSSS